MLQRQHIALRCPHFRDIALERFTPLSLGQHQPMWDRSRNNSCLSNNIDLARLHFRQQYLYPSTTWTLSTPFLNSSHPFIHYNMAPNICQGRCGAPNPRSSTKLSFQSVPNSNYKLMTKIDKLVKKRQDAITCANTSQTSVTVDDEDEVKALLKQIYEAICTFAIYRGQPSTPDRTIITAWESFLDPIKILRALKPHGDFLCARMTLYLTNSFLASWAMPRGFPALASSAGPIALRCNLLIALDDCLLACLTRIWSNDPTKRSEMFDWVFAEYSVSDRCRFGKEDKLDMDLPGYINIKSPFSRTETACLTNPSDMTALNGVRGREMWFRREGDTTPYQRHPNASCFGFNNSQNGQDELIAWQAIGSDGPIRDEYHYHLIDEDNGQATWRARPNLRRSRQFILDARKVAARNTLRYRQVLAAVGLAKTPLPTELRMQVLSYLELPPSDHLYVDNLDLTAEYSPFPELGAKCSACLSRASTKVDKFIKRTCPHKAITTWSLPLRTFQTWHEGAPGQWGLCKEVNCTGHHQNLDWKVENEQQLALHLETIVQNRCGSDATLENMGMGCVPNLVAETEEEDRLRMKKLLDKEWWNKDAEEEAKWTGLGGLVDVMVHRRTLLSMHRSGQGSTNSSWMLGRTRNEESKVEDFSQAFSNRR